MSLLNQRLRALPTFMLVAASFLIAATTARNVFGEFLATSAKTDEVLRLSDTGSPRGVFVAAGSGGLNAPTSMTWGPDGDLYVATFDGYIRDFDGVSGAYKRTLIHNSNAIWFGMCTTANGDLLASDIAADVVRRINPVTGAVVASIGQGVFADPTHMILGRDGRLLVANNYARTHLIYAVDLSNNSVTGIFSSPGQLVGPCGMDYGPDGNLYVSDLYGSGSVDRIDAHTGAEYGIFVQGMSQSAPDLLFTPNGKMFVSDLFSGTLARYNGITGDLESTSSAGNELDDLLYVPEPGSAAMISIAAGGMVLRRRAGAGARRPGAPSCLHAD